MKRLVIDLLLAVVVVLAATLAVTGGVGWPVRATEPEVAVAKATPFTTHSEMLFIALTVSKANPPVIAELTILPEGRASYPTDGDNRVELLGQENEVVYTLPFAVDWLSSAHGAAERSEVECTFILPYDARAVKVVVTTPAGQTTQLLP